MNENMAPWQISALDLEIRIIIPCGFFLVIKEILVKTTITIFFNDVEAKIKFLPVNFADVIKPRQW